MLIQISISIYVSSLQAHQLFALLFEFANLKIYSCMTGCLFLASNQANTKMNYYYYYYYQ